MPDQMAIPSKRRRHTTEKTTAKPAAALRPRRDVELCRRGEIRAERFLEAATEVFLEKGYRNARLSDIVARAGGSLSTLYRVFGDKEGLVHAIMEDSIQAFGEGLEILGRSEMLPDQALMAAAERMSAEILTPGRIVSHRIVIAEGLSFPELRDWFFEHGVAPAERKLTEYFHREKAAGRLVLDSPAVSADRFYMMVFGGVIIRSVNGNVTAADIDRIQVETREAVKIFLHGVLPR